MPTDREPLTSKELLAALDAPCPVCGGSGRKHFPEWGGDGPGQSTPCQTCHGTGKLIPLEVREGVADLRDRLTKAEADTKRLRQMLWLRHGCPVHALYGDDGKMDCNHCMIDFKGAEPGDIEYRFRELGRRAAIASQEKAKVQP